MPACLCVWCIRVYLDLLYLVCAWRPGISARFLMAFYLVFLRQCHTLDLTDSLCLGPLSSEVVAVHCHTCLFALVLMQSSNLHSCAVLYWLNNLPSPLTYLLKESLFLLLIVCVSPCVHMCTHALVHAHMWVQSVEARRGPQIPWSWS